MRSQTKVASLACVALVALGLPDGLLGVAWHSIRTYFGLPIDALGFLLVMFTCGYLVSSFSSGRLLEGMNVGTLLTLSCFLAGASVIGYAVTPRWWVMVALGCLSGLGAGAIDAGLNTFAATHFSARMVNWFHAFYGVGAATGPIIMSSVLAAHRPWQRGYLIVGGFQFLLAVSFGFTRKLWSEQGAGHDTSEVTRVKNASSMTTLRVPIVWLGMVIFFVYTGIEAAAGMWAFTLFTEARGASMLTASAWVSIYWGSLTGGRLLSGFAAGFVQVDRLVTWSIVGVVFGAALICVGGSSIFSFLGLGLMGLASAPIFPSLIASTPARVGATHARNAIGFEIAAAVLGQSLLPSLIGLMAKRVGVEVVATSLLCSAAVLAALHLWLPGSSSGVRRELSVTA